MNKVLFILFLFSGKLISQVPVFGNDIPVTINNYSLDAMEPFISPDGNAMFFNSLNDGNMTSLYYAAKVNDSTFNLVGQVPVVNQTVTPRLDGVASLDTSNNFYWVSNRGYPAEMDNLHRIRFLQTGYTNFGRVHGNIYVYSPGWIIMDAFINYHGDKLLYCNAYFNACPFNMPCKSAIAYGQKINDSTFTKFPNSGTIFNNVNDTINYVVYAPQLSKDELELYYTRLLKNVAQTEICVAVRSNTNNPFGTPSIIVPMSSNLPEAATITTDKSKLYYHVKSGGVFKLFLRKRVGVTDIEEQQSLQVTKIYPNPNYGILKVESPVEFTLYLYNCSGQEILSSTSRTIDISAFPVGIYYIKTVTKTAVLTQKLILSGN